MKRKIKFSVPRRDTDLMVDLLHLNGFSTQVVAENGRAPNIVVSIDESDFLSEERPEEDRPEPPLKLCS